MNRGEIVDYEITDADVSTNDTLVSGDSFPMLVVSVNDNDETYSGIVFTLGGSFTAHVAPDAPPEPADTSSFDAFESGIGNLTDAQRDELRAKLAQYPDAAPASQAPADPPPAPETPPVTDVPPVDTTPNSEVQ